MAEGRDFQELFAHQEVVRNEEEWNETTQPDAESTSPVIDTYHQKGQFPAKQTTEAKHVHILWNEKTECESRAEEEQLRQIPSLSSGGYEELHRRMFSSRIPQANSTNRSSIYYSRT
jgi:hypothetical protein